MVFIGFGFLMTFMRRYSFGAVGLNYFASALMILEAIICIGACQQVGSTLITAFGPVSLG